MGIVSLRCAILLACVLLGVGALHAAPPPSSATAQQPTIERLLLARRWDEAHTRITAALRANPADTTLLYNDACALAQLGKLDLAAEQLLASVKAGFRDFNLLESDPDLEPVRSHATYTAILEAAASVPQKSRERPARTPAALESFKQAHGDRYRYEHDAAHGLWYATTLSETSHARMRLMLDQLADHLASAYFGEMPRQEVLIAVLREADASKYLSNEAVRGMYEHGSRRLVTRDTGGSLQHEFVHLMHFAFMERSGQRHPIWMQEGLASLYEDYDRDAAGKFTFRPNMRHNFARKQVKSGTAQSWRSLFAMSAKTFMDDAERLYPEVRSIFEFLAREKKCETFFAEYILTYDLDASGVTALERAFHEPLNTIEQHWRKWVIARGTIDDTVQRGDAALGVQTEDTGDGARIVRFLKGSAAEAAGLRVGDVIIEVAEEPVRSLIELQMACAKLRVGMAVGVRYRRGTTDATAQVTPQVLR